MDDLDRLLRVACTRRDWYAAWRAARLGHRVHPAVLMLAKRAAEACRRARRAPDAIERTQKRLGAHVATKVRERRHPPIEWDIRGREGWREDFHADG